MEAIDALSGAAAAVRGAVAGMAGTPEAAGDNGVGAGGDVSRNIDIAAERAVLDHLGSAGFGCTVLGEECGRVEVPGGPGGFVVMDAIDGSANAVRGVPFFCCSLAYAPEGRLSSVSAAVVADLAGGGTYRATAGGGASLDGAAVRVASGEPVYRIVGANTSGAAPGLMRMLRPVFERHNHTRHFGANALEMAMLAAGRMDVFVDLRSKIRVQDIAAGYLLVREAGGIVLDSGLEPLDSGLGYSERLSFLAASGREALDDVLSDMGE